MGTITAQAIIDKARTELFDDAKERWSDATLLGYLNEGQRAIVTMKPNAYVTNGTVAVASGTKQAIPANATILIDIPRNVSGRVVRAADRKKLDAKAPLWHTATPDDEVRHFMYDIDNPRNWYCYPPNTGAGQVEMIYGAMPPDVTTNQAISVDDIYEIPLVDYTLYRAFALDSEYSADQTRSDKHLAAFVAALTGKARGEVGAKPAGAG